MEESAKVLEIETFIPMLLQRQEDGYARILIGYHHQLPPVVKNIAFQKYSHMDQSLFTRFVRLGIPSPWFYQNEGEAEYIVSVYIYMRLLGYPANKISILTTYNGQKLLIRDVINRLCIPYEFIGPPNKAKCMAYWGQVAGSTSVFEDQTSHQISTSGHHGADAEAPKYENTAPENVPAESNMEEGTKADEVSNGQNESEVRLNGQTDENPESNSEGTKMEE